MKAVKLIEQREIKPNHPLFSKLDNLCFLSKNLYNATLYRVRQEYFETKKYLNYNAVNLEFTKENQVDYRALPAKVSKMTQMLVDKNFKSFFSGLKSKTISKARPPKYLPKDGRQVVTYSKQSLSFKKKGYVRLSMTDIYIKTNKDNIEFVRVVPKGKYLNIEIGYKVDVKEHKYNGNIASIDLGLNNLVSLVSNVSEPLLINGKPLKSINQYYNKEKARLMSELSKHNKKYSHRLNRIHLKRNNKVKDYIHKTTSKVLNHLVSNNITTLVIGYNKEWKQDITLGKKNNQNFVGIPFLMLVNQLMYKCELQGIKVVLQEESYTSKCSFIDNEDIKKHETYNGRRLKRGLFRASNGSLINADINGALNILKKYLLKQEAWDENIFLNLVEVSSRPIASAINL